MQLLNTWHLAQEPLYHLINSYNTFGGVKGWLCKLLVFTAMKCLKFHCSIRTVIKKILSLNCLLKSKFKQVSIKIDKNYQKPSNCSFVFSLLGSWCAESAGSSLWDSFFSMAISVYTCNTIPRSQLMHTLLHAAKRYHTSELGRYIYAGEYKFAYEQMCLDHIRKFEQNKARLSACGIQP